MLCIMDECNGGRETRVDVATRADVANKTVFHSYNVTAEQLFDLFGKFGPIR